MVEARITTTASGNENSRSCRVPFEAKVKKFLDELCQEADPIVCKLGQTFIYKNYRHCIRETLSAYQSSLAVATKGPEEKSEYSLDAQDDGWIETRALK
jgi:hypothetical protein